MKNNSVFWDVTPFGSWKNRRFGGRYRLQLQPHMPLPSLLCPILMFPFYTVFLRGALPLLITANVPSSPTLVALMTEAIRSSETSILTRATRRNIPEHGILHSRRRVKSYIALTSWALQRISNVFPARCEMCFYMPEDSILRSHHRENLNSYNTKDTALEQTLRQDQANEQCKQTIVSRNVKEQGHGKYNSDSEPKW
jgi:hypothetical protein